MQLESSSFVAVAELVEALSEHAGRIDCQGGRTLFRQGDRPVGLFVIHSGEVTITMQDAAGNTVLRFAARPGSLLGLPAVVGNTPYTLSAEAAQDAQVSLVPHQDFTRLMTTRPGLAIKILEVLAAEVRAARSMIAGCQ